jgi:hypothetical protein
MAPGFGDTDQVQQQVLNSITHQQAHVKQAVNAELPCRGMCRELPTTSSPQIYGCLAETSCH